MVDFVREFHTRTDLAVRWIVKHLAVAPSRFYRWATRYGRVNTHNGRLSRDHWVTPEEDCEP